MLSRSWMTRAFDPMRVKCRTSECVKTTAAARAAEAAATLHAALVVLPRTHQPAGLGHEHRHGLAPAHTPTELGTFGV